MGQGAGRAGDRTGKEASCAVEQQLRSTFPRINFALSGTADWSEIALNREIAGWMSSELDIRDDERFPMGSRWIDRGPQRRNADEDGT